MPSSPSYDPLASLSIGLDAHAERAYTYRAGHVRSGLARSLSYLFGRGLSLDLLKGKSDHV